MNDFLPIGSLAGRTGAPVGGGVLYPGRGGQQRMPQPFTRGDSVFAPTFQGYRTGYTPQMAGSPILERANYTPPGGMGAMGGAGGSMHSSGGGGGGGFQVKGFGGNKAGTLDGRIHGGVSPPSQGTRTGGFTSLPPIGGTGVFGFGGQGNFQQPSQRYVIPPTMPGYADGGKPPLGTPVRVGERGPETVVFDPATGQPNVIPNEVTDDSWSNKIWGAAKIASNPFGPMQTAIQPYLGQLGAAVESAGQPFAPLQPGIQAANSWVNNLPWVRNTFPDLVGPETDTSYSGTGGSFGPPGTPQASGPGASQFVQFPVSGIAPVTAPIWPSGSKGTSGIGSSTLVNPFTGQTQTPGMVGAQEFSVPPPAIVPQPDQNVPRGTIPGNITNAYTIGAPAQFEAATAWARRLFQNAQAFPDNPELRDQAQKAAQWAGMTTAQRTAALAHGEREVSRAERLGKASDAVAAQQEDPALWARLAEFNRTGVLPEETRATIRGAPVPFGTPADQIPRQLTSTYGSGAFELGAQPRGLFGTPYGQTDMTTLRQEDAARTARLQQLWDQRNTNLRRQALRR